MFDNLRDSSDSSFYEEEQNDLYKEPNPARKSTRVSAAPSQRKGKSKQFLGLTPPQRFVISLMFMFTICIMGTLAMLVMGKMGF